MWLNLLSDLTKELLRTEIYGYLQDLYKTTIIYVIGDSASYVQGCLARPGRKQANVSVRMA